MVKIKDCQSEKIFKNDSVIVILKCQVIIFELKCDREFILFEINNLNMVGYYSFIFVIIFMLIVMLYGCKLLIILF